MAVHCVILKEALYMATAIFLVHYFAQGVQGLTFPNARYEIVEKMKEIQTRSRRSLNSQILFQPSCGNGFVEPGEECDCGTSKQCTNPCCDATTCKLAPMAECAEGKCCDKCKISPKGKICRQSTTEECDITETCDGTNSMCSTDLHVEDFSSCENRNSFCKNGKCNPSLQDQCKRLWGQNALHGKCSVLNRRGDKWGNCGKDDKGTYIRCQAKDENCGKLQCYGDQLSRFITFGTSRSTKLITFNSNGLRIPCRSGVTNIGNSPRDPTLALDGSKCGKGKACSNQHCVDVSTVIEAESKCHQRCGKNGKCTNAGVCYCQAGYKCPDCELSYATNINGMVCVTPPIATTTTTTTTSKTPQ